jgi:PAS domain S-box-containing protein
MRAKSLIHLATRFARHRKYGGTKVAKRFPPSATRHSMINPPTHLNTPAGTKCAAHAAESDAVLERNRQLVSIIEATTDYVGIADLEGRSLYVNSHGRRMVGKPDPGDADVPWHISGCHPVTELARLEQAFAAIRRGETWAGETRLLRADGHDFPVSAVMFGLPDASGRIEAVAAMFRDISEQKRMEQMLRESEERFRTLIDNAPEAIMVFDADSGRVIEISQSVADLFGLTREQVLALHPAAMSPPLQPNGRSSLVMADEIIARVLGGERAIFEWVHLNSRSEEFPCEIRLVRLPYSGRRLLRATVIDISARKRAEAQLHQAKEAAEKALADSRRLTAILESTSDFVSIADARGLVQYINRAGRRMLGIGEHESLERYDFGRLFPPEAAERIFAEGIPAALREGTWNVEIELIHLDGRRIPTSFVGIVHESPEGKLSLSCIARDFTSHRRVQAELQDAKEAAEAASRAKSTFLANMSHELRTPMNAVIGMTGLLLNTPMNAKQLEFVETVRQAGDSLLAVINDILDFSKIEAGHMELECQPLDLRGCIESALDLLAPRAAEKGIDLACVMQPGVPDGIHGDVTRLRQVLVNLIGNAVKFTQTGEVVVCVKELERDQDTGGVTVPPQLQFSVRDTGIGMPPERIGQLFRSFTQLDASTTRQYGGTGLGLAISKRLAEMMGGTMWAESPGPGRGATFHFTCVACPAEAPGRRYLQHPRPELSGKRVLIVDDNSTNRRILYLQLQAWGMMSHLAADATEALSALRGGERFDAAILDMHLSPQAQQRETLDGLDLARAMRRQQDQGAPRLPLIMLTSANANHDDAPDVELAAFLTKPVKPSQLYDVLVGVFAQGYRPPRRRATPRIKPPAARSALRILVVEDVAVNQKFVMMALEDMGFSADIAANGIEAIEAVCRQPYDLILMDVQMPEMDGLEATRRIHRLWSQDGMALPTASRPRIVAMTANALPGDREICLSAGMDDYISKPIYIEELGAVIDRNSRVQGASTQAQITKAPASTPGTGWTDAALVGRLLARRGGRLVIEQYLDEAGAMLARLRGAASAADMTAMRDAAHRLKGCSAYVGARDLVAYCAALERASAESKVDATTSLLRDIGHAFACVSRELRTALGLAAAESEA